MSALTSSRLLQLSSQALPIGGFSHSHGLEAAIESGVIADESNTLAWLRDVLHFSLRTFEVPCLRGMRTAWSQQDFAALPELNQEFLATRETAELRAAAVQMGFSMRALLEVLADVPSSTHAVLHALTEASLPCVWSAAADAWRIATVDMVVGYLWAWAENQVLAAMRTLPLGQSAGQRVLVTIGSEIAQVAECLPQIAAHSPAAAWSNFSPGLAILSSQHETQYSRLFRS